MRRIAATAGAVALGLSLSACGTHSVSTAADQVALHYSGGPFSSKAYRSYVPASTKKWFGPGDKEYMYPAGQRTYDATGGKKAERDSITSVSADSVEMATKVSITFQLKTDEKSLRAFHEKVGIKYKAYMDGDETSEGWRTLLDFYIGQSLETTLDREVANYNWRDLYNKPEIRVKLQAEVNKELPDLVRAKIQGDYFYDFSAQVQKPDVTNDALKQAIADSQNNVAKAQAQQAQAQAQLATAQAQLALQRVEAQKQRALIAGYGSTDAYLKALLIQQGGNPYQPSYGAPQTTIPGPSPSPS
jgi:hypothetical protein